MSSQLSASSVVFLGLVFSLYSPCCVVVDAGKCELLKKSLCSHLRYNMTLMPNIFGQRSQFEAIKEMLIAKPLLQIECAKDLDLFLCSMYLPMCIGKNVLASRQTSSQEVPVIVPPCRSLCNNVKSSCEVVMNKFGYNWPTSWSCAGFPELGTGAACVFRNTSQSSTGSGTSPKTSSSKAGKSVKKTKTRTNVSLREMNKICMGSSEESSKRCCRYGHKAGKMGLKRCSPRKRGAKKLSSRKARSFVKRVVKFCLRSRTNKTCYSQCCQYKKRQLRNKKRKQNKKRRP